MTSLAAGEPPAVVPQARKPAVRFADVDPSEISPLTIPDPADDSSTHSRAGAEARSGAQQALQQILEGNHRFLKGDCLRCKPDLELLKELRDSQAPYAVVLACADSRVPPELVLDQGLGDIFTVRVTGNCVNDFVMGSILNAVQRLGARLVLVMGHTRCTIVAKAVHAWAKEQKKGWATSAAGSAQAGPSSKQDLQPIVESRPYDGQRSQTIPPSPFQKASQESQPQDSNTGSTKGKPSSSSGGGFFSKMNCCGGIAPAEAPMPQHANGTRSEDPPPPAGTADRAAPRANLDRPSANPVQAIVGAINHAVVAVAHNDKLKHVLSHVHRVDEQGDIGLQSKDSLGLTRARLTRERDHTKPDLYNNISAIQGVDDVISENVRLSTAAVLKGLMKALDPTIASECEVVASVFDLDTGKLKVLKRGWISGRSIYYDELTVAA